MQLNDWEQRLGTRWGATLPRVAAESRGPTCHAHAHRLLARLRCKAMVQRRGWQATICVCHTPGVKLAREDAGVGHATNACNRRHVCRAAWCAPAVHEMQEVETMSSSTHRLFVLDERQLEQAALLVQRRLQLVQIHPQVVGVEELVPAAAGRHNHDQRAVIRRGEDAELLRI